VCVCACVCVCVCVWDVWVCVCVCVWVWVCGCVGCVGVCVWSFTRLLPWPHHHNHHHLFLVALHCSPLLFTNCLPPSSSLHNLPGAKKAAALKEIVQREKQVSKAREAFQSHRHSRFSAYFAVVDDAANDDDAENKKQVSKSRLK
jgi:hypothetical protein